MTEFIRARDGVDIAYEKMGVGPPVILVHGFAASRIITWKNTGWYEWLLGMGRSVIAFDCRGHGESGKPHSPEAYDDWKMAMDIVMMMEAHDTESAPVMGYSMGSYLAVALMHLAPKRVERAVLAGVGENYFSFWEERSERIAKGLQAADPGALSDNTAIEFRAFAERAGNDLDALAACMRRARLMCTAWDLGQMPQPILVVSGEDDRMAGRPAPLAAHFVNGAAVSVPGRNHHSTVGDRAFKEAVRDFLNRSL
jgi:pimeloyl-ACP methyl ester carboxylesterase